MARLFLLDAPKLQKMLLRYRKIIQFLVQNVGYDSYYKDFYMIIISITDVRNQWAISNDDT